MRYYLDTEFDGFGGALISLALVREDGDSRYLLYSERAVTPWVRENVIPVLRSDCPNPLSGHATHLAHIIAEYLRNDREVEIISDWPDDIKYFCQAVITGSGEMVGLDRLTFKLIRVDAYPSTLQGAVQHNAWWDAMALRHKLQSN